MIKYIIYLIFYVFIIWHLIVNNLYACNIKWNISFNSWEKIYHLPWCEFYNSTIIDVRYWEKWFCTEEEARRNWWRKSIGCNSVYNDNQGNIQKNAKIRNKLISEKILEQKPKIILEKLPEIKKDIIPAIDEETLFSYQNSAEMLAKAGIINYQEKKNDYQVQNSISRREILKIIIKFSWKNLWDTCEWKFRDVPKNDWGCVYIETALDFWLINGNPTFRPNDKVSKIEALKMILNSKNISVEKTTNWSDWYISKWIELWLFESLENGTDFSTRGFIFEIIWKLLNLNNVSNSDINNTSTSIWEEDDLWNLFSDLFWEDDPSGLFWEILKKEDEGVIFEELAILKANNLSQLWIIADYSNDTSKYYINNYITKWEFIKIIMNTSSISEIDNCEWLFQDLTKDNWECKYAEIALKAWFIPKTNVFEPNKFVTYDEALVLIWKVRWLEIEDTKWIINYFNTFIDDFDTIFEKYIWQNITKWNVYILTDLMIYMTTATQEEEQPVEWEDEDLWELLGDLVSEN